MFFGTVISYSLTYYLLRKLFEYSDVKEFVSRGPEGRSKYLLKLVNIINGIVTPILLLDQFYRACSDDGEFPLPYDKNDSHHWAFWYDDLCSI